MVTELLADEFQLRGPAYPGCARRAVPVGIEFTSTKNLDRQQLVYLSLPDAQDLYYRLGELLEKLREPAEEP